MSWLENVRNQPKEKKLRLIWMFAAISVIILVVLWIITAQVKKDVPRDTSLFDTIGRGVKDLRQNYNKPIQ